MARQKFLEDNLTTQETAFGVLLLLTTCWIAYLVRLALSRRQTRHTWHFQ
jgi:hypothetical protein